MADYYTKFSLIVKLPDKAAQKQAFELAGRAGSINRGEEPGVDFPASLLEVIEEWQFETELESSADSPGLWLHSEDGGIDAACAFIQHLLKTFDPTSHLSFEWSNDCSKPRVDAYGGGAAIITAEEIQTMSTAQWVESHTSDAVP